jgi:hypothetical protein
MLQNSISGDARIITTPRPFARKKLSTGGYIVFDEALRSFGLMIQFAPLLFVSVSRI